MKQFRSWILLGLTAPALLALARPADEILFAPASGLRLEKTFEVSVDSAIDDMEVILDGNEMPAPPLEVETTQANSITVTDSYVKSEGGQVLVLERTYNELAGDVSVSMVHPMQGPVEQEMNSVSDLEGTTVVFHWDAEQEAYEAEFAEEDADEDEELLEGLLQDMDFVEFLPDGAVSVDDSWSFPASAISSVLAPGGYLSMLPEEVSAEMESSAGLDFARQLGDLEGDCTATYTGSKRTDGGVLATISLTIEASSTRDITEFMAEAVRNNAEQLKAANMEQEIQSADASFEFDLTGELIWNVDGGHFESIELTGSTDIVIDLAMSMTVMGKSMDMENAIYSSGEITATASAMVASAE